MRATVLLVAFLLALAAPAFAQTTPTTIGAMTNITATVAAASVTSFTSVVPVVQKSGLAMSGMFASASADTAAMVFYFYASADGTNLATWPFDTLTVLANGTGATPVKWTKNWSADQLAGYKWVGLGAVSNAHATVLRTNYWVIYSRPN